MKRDLQTYMRLCAITDRLLARHNPCKNCKGCGLFAQPYDCCNGCPFNGPTGCVTACLACKLWLCDPLPKRRLSRRFRHQLNRLKRITDELNLNYARATPLEVLLMTEKKGVWFLYHGLQREGYR